MGVLCREKLNRCDDRVEKYCTDCRRRRLPNKIETTPHLIKCSPLSKQIFQEATLIHDKIMTETERRLKSTSLPEIKNQCSKLLDYTVHENLTDIILGIGKIQLFKLVCNKKYKSIVPEIEIMQSTILKILSRKKRLYSSYQGRVDAMIREQILVPAFGLS